MTIFPKLSFDVNDDEKLALEKLNNKHEAKFLIIPKKISKAKAYRLINKLKNKQFIRNEGTKYFLTDAGKIALL